MCDDLIAKVRSDVSLAAPALAAVKAFQRISNNPSKIATALHMFARYTNTRLASVRSKAIRRAPRHAGPMIPAQPTSQARRRTLKIGGKRRIVAGRPKTVTTGPDHVYSQPSKKTRVLAPHYMANSVSENKRHPK